MQVKIDTKEKFHIIVPTEKIISATMTDGMDVVLRSYLQNEIKNVVFNLENVLHIDQEAAEHLLQVQQEFYRNNGSFVVCCMQKPVEEMLAAEQLLELFNATPTESEAWDIVQMEEVERELMDGDDWEESPL